LGRLTVSARVPRRAVRAGSVAVAAVIVGTLLAPAAGDAATAGQAARAGVDARLYGADAHATIARLEARAANLSRQYRGELETLAGSEADAQAAAARARWVRRELEVSRHQVAKMAVASYLSGATDQALMTLFSGRPQRILDKAAIITYLAKQRGARRRALQALMRAAESADRAAAAKIAALRRMITALEQQKQTVEHLLAKFRPQSPVIGDNITPRMRQVKDAIDRRFGPFAAIGCYRQEATGEHPLGRACDFMLSTGGVMPSAPWIKRGYEIAAWAQAHAAQLGIMYIIYRQRIWDIRMASAGWVPMPDRGSITANHYDHVHISVF
jgi:hypothetical protein